jgi:hypothetical protein
MSLKRYKLLITLVLPLLFLAACADKSVEVANNTMVQTASELNEYSKSLEKQGHYGLSDRVFTHNDNEDSICQIYVDALNTYGIVDDFFKAPAQPNSPEFGYPEWEQLDIYEHKDVFLKAQKYMVDGYRSIYYDNASISVYDMRNTIIIDSNQSEEIKARNRRDWQMYYTRADMHNNGELKNVLKLDRGRYYDGSRSDLLFNTFLIIFDDKSEKTFNHVDNKNRLFTHMIWEAGNYDIFFYNGQTYVKQVSVEVNSGKVYDIDEWFELSIYMYSFSSSPSCYIE